MGAFVASSMSIAGHLAELVGYKTGVRGGGKLGQWGCR